ncbi:hypothetical protein HU200_003506 [Digitaria exilis]|uniref:Uncharacterized protein n=1 Tax=Digitaria exilis TaxID=1010633 RepID=A0A835KY91_9POAL|nr:hypothetical protein HU200_003506 [Digitaria exilis]
MRGIAKNPGGYLHGGRRTHEMMTRPAARLRRSGGRRSGVATISGAQEKLVPVLETLYYCVKGRGGRLGRHGWSKITTVAFTESVFAGGWLWCDVRPRRARCVAVLSRCRETSGLAPPQPQRLGYVIEPPREVVVKRCSIPEQYHQFLPCLTCPEVGERLAPLPRTICAISRFVAWRAHPGPGCRLSLMRLKPFSCQPCHEPPPGLENPSAQIFMRVDIRGDAYGMLAAHPVAPVVSLHHLDHIEPISPRGKTALEAARPLVGASRLDPARTLQQSFCYQHGPGGYVWSVSVAWGYTVQLYPWAVAPHDLEVPLQTFRTWRSWADGPFVFNTRPPGGGDACARPAMFFLSAARNETAAPARATVTEYAKHDAGSPPGTKKECDRASFRAASTVHTVRVVAPRMSESDWWRRVSGRRRRLLQDEADEVGLGAGGADTTLRPRRAHLAVISRHVNGHEDSTARATN